MKIILIIFLVFAILSCRYQNEFKQKIIGEWDGEIKLPKTKKSIGKMHLKFTENGEFFQTTGNDSDKVTSKMTFRINSKKIFYKGRATGNEEFDSNYHFRGDILVLEIDGESTEYVRSK